MRLVNPKDDDISLSHILFNYDLDRADNSGGRHTWPSAKLDRVGLSLIYVRQSFC